MPKRLNIQNISVCLHSYEELPNLVNQVQDLGQNVSTFPRVDRSLIKNSSLEREESKNDVFAYQTILTNQELARQMPEIQGHDISI